MSIRRSPRRESAAGGAAAGTGAGAAAAAAAGAATGWAAAGGASSVSAPGWKGKDIGIMLIKWFHSVVTYKGCARVKILQIWVTEQSFYAYDGSS